MDELRWILLVCGGLVVAGVFLYSRRQSASSGDGVANRAAEASPDLSAQTRLEPSFGEEPEPLRPTTDVDIPVAAVDPAGEQIDIEDVTGEPVQKAPQKIVTVRIVANDKSPFPGDQLVLSLRGIGMRHGRFGIFHRYDGNDEDRVIFSAASLVEPGSFQLENIRDQKIPGISLFMVLPGPIDGAESFDLMMAAARTLTQSLGAELLDESGSSLSIQRERYLREEIIQYQLDHRLA